MAPIDYFPVTVFGTLDAREKISMTFLLYFDRLPDLARLRPYLIFSVALFVFGAITGSLTIIFDPEIAFQLQKLLQQFVGMFHGMSRFQLFMGIFFNNSLKTLLAVLLGPLLGIVPVVFLLINGAILGAVIPMAVVAKGLWSSVMTIVPHGIFELPAVFLGTSVGIQLGLHPLMRLAGKADSSLLSEMGKAMRLYFVIILPLLLLAALIEVFVTPFVVGG